MNRKHLRLCIIILMIIGNLTWVVPESYEKIVSTCQLVSRFGLAYLAVESYLLSHYQGEEIGLPNSYFESLETYRDIETINMIRILREKGLTESEVTEIIHERSRDNGRTPIPWNHSYQHGFTTGKPWLALSEYPELHTVEDNLAEPNSIFYTYQALIKLRKELPVIQSGNIEFLELEHPELLIYKRVLDNESVIVYCNFSDKDIDYDGINHQGEILLSNYDAISVSEKNTFKPYEALVLKI